MFRVVPLTRGRATTTFARLVPGLSIRWKLIIAFAGLSVLPVVLVGVYGIESNVGTLKRIALVNLTHDVHTVRERTENFLAGVETDMRVLRSTGAVDLYMRHAMAGISPDVREREQIADGFLTFARTKGIFYQLRILTKDNEEYLRIECDDITDSAKHFRALTDSELPRGGEQFYSILTEHVQGDAIAFAPVELRYRSGGQVPAMTFAMPLRIGSRRVGTLIANVFAGFLFQAMQARREVDERERVVFVAGDGHYVYTSDTRADWNALIAMREEDNLRRDYPPNVSSRILSGTEGVIHDGVGEIIAYAPLFPMRASPGDSTRDAGTPAPAVFAGVPEGVIAGPAREFATTFAGFLIVFLASAVGLGLLATRQFTQPIAALQRGAEIIAHGNFHHRLTVVTHDEIERLAEQFNAMAAALEVRDEEIARHRTGLEEIVRSRSAELYNEKTAMQAILDNVPSAFVLLDDAFRIRSASAAFTAITGLQRAEALGQDGRTLLPMRGFCADSVAAAASDSGRVEGHIDRQVDANGVERFFEHVAIPLNGGLAGRSMLEIITDVTKRKRLELQLIQSEKLMATGEMSAIIAHEFRNALTSVKLILQLQHEAAPIPPKNRASLGVALESIHHMESIVRELLSFARPTPLEFRVESLVAPLEECCAFIRLRVQKEAIRVTSMIDTTLPPTLVDLPRIKEAIINLLLNAVQAIEVHGSSGGRGEVAVTAVGPVSLPRTLRDSVTGEAVDVDDELFPHAPRDITLRKGTACIVISVRDNGPGIERAQQQRVFDPFFTTKVTGTGLGLPMVKRTVNAHGGIVTLHSAPGEGAVFEITLPIRNESA